MIQAIQTIDNPTTQNDHSQNNWQMVSRFQTLEAAEKALQELKSSGQNASLSMIDGLSVIVSDEL